LQAQLYKPVCEEFRSDAIPESQSRPVRHLASDADCFWRVTMIRPLHFLDRYTAGIMIWALGADLLVFFVMLLIDFCKETWTAAHPLPLIIIPGVVAAVMFGLMLFDSLWRLREPRKLIALLVIGVFLNAAPVVVSGWAGHKFSHPLPKLVYDKLPF
jgi:hypothetical protein